MKKRILRGKKPRLFQSKTKHSTLPNIPFPTNTEQHDHFSPKGAELPVESAPSGFGIRRVYFLSASNRFRRAALAWRQV